jgi:dephospho-CoA kinase
VLTVALTGGIGTGKSTVTGILRGMGVTVIDADEAVRAVQAPGQEGLRLLVEAFGAGILAPDGSLDRPAMAARVFGDAGARARLEGIIHPLVRRWMAERHRDAVERGETLVVHDIPLLFETGRQADFDAVVVVYAPEEEQLRRLTELRGMSEPDARARIAAQIPIERKRSTASVVIDNTGTQEELTSAVAAALAELTPPR